MARRITLLIALGSIVATTPVHPQPTLQSPESFLGYRLGERFTPHQRIVDYFEYVASERPTVRLVPYGATYEDRPLLVAAVSNERNMQRLEEIRLDNLRRAGSVEGEPSGEGIAIVWLSYNVHGNEAVSSEVSMAALHTLADAANERTQAWLERTVVLIDPCLNPDGHERYVSWYRQTRSVTPDPTPDAREHAEPWPGGRGNHYLFDLNRDWAWQTQQESRARAELYRAWMPAVHVDFHEQGINSPYYFAPAAEPYHEVVTDWQRSFQGTIGRNHARYFDANGWLYFSKEVFDLLYPSYGDTWPTYHGSIGMTYEQAGGGRAGLAIETATGDTLTLADRIAHHLATSLSTVEVAAQHADELLAEFQLYFEKARNEPAGRYRSYVIAASSTRDDVDALLVLLDRQGIRYGRMGQERTVRAFDYKTGSIENVRVQADDIVVSALQPTSAMVTALFEPSTVLSDSLTYDITAWSLPYAFGLDAFATTETLLPASDVPSPPSGPLVGGPDRAYAYLGDYESLADLRLVAALLTAGIKVRFASRPFVMQGNRYQPGTLIILRADNTRLGDRFDNRVREAAEQVRQPLLAVHSGMVAEGADFGSSNVRFMDRPTVALLGGDGVWSTAFGEIWHFFEQQLGYPVTVLEASDLGRAGLESYDVIVMPNGYYGEALSDHDAERLRAWVREGGRLIALENAVSYLAGLEGFGIKAKRAGEESEEDTSDVRPELLRRYDERERDDARNEVSGSIFAVEMDTGHPLAFGMSDPYFTLKRSDVAFAYLERGWNVGVLAKDGYRSGFTGSEAREKLQDGLLFGMESLGRGSVVYLVDNPLFRGFWHKGKLLLGNAVFFVGQ